MNFFRFWGWGGEDDDFNGRLNVKGHKPKRLSKPNGRFKV